MNILRNNRGVTLVFVAMGLLLFLLFLGVALDTGWVVYVRSQGQARVDSAALAAAGALIEKPFDPLRPEELANTFSDKNSVVNASVNPVNRVTLMNYDQISGVLQEAPSPYGGSVLYNAVRVTTDVPTPVFFAGIRNVFGAGETGQENITVGAVSHLPCPGIETRGDQLAQLVIAKAFWNFPAGCNVSHSFASLNLGQGNAVLARATVSVPVQVGTFIVPQLSPLTQGDLERLVKSCGDSTIVPVVENVGSGSTKIEGFASICRSGTGGAIAIRLQCGEVALGSAGVGECFGTYASNPILIQ